jgi:hypothetical protein
VRHVDRLIGGALAELGDVVGDLLGLSFGDLRHDGFPSVLVTAVGRTALCCSTIDGDHAALQQEDEGTETKYYEI